MNIELTPQERNFVLALFRIAMQAENVNLLNQGAAMVMQSSYLAIASAQEPAPPLHEGDPPAAMPKRQRKAA